MSVENGVFKVGSRKSELALIQTNSVVDSIKLFYPQKKCEVVSMSTIGDKILDKPLPKIGEKSLFTKELEIALEAKNVDFVVHSLKDLPTTLPDGLAIGAVLKREDPRDAVILHSKHRGCILGSLPDGSVIGTSSLRRTAQLKRKYPRLEVKDIRGNLQTRLRKLKKGDYDGIVLAVAGIHRMGWEHEISQILEVNEMLYAVGQGSLAIECRTEDCKTFWKLSDIDSALRSVTERALLQGLEAGCSAPVAVYSSFQENTLKLKAAVWSLDGTKEIMITKQITLPESVSKSDKLFCGLSACGLNTDHLQAAFDLGKGLSSDMIEKGAMKIILESKAEIENGS